MSSIKLSNYKTNVKLIYLIYILYAFSICYNVVQVLFFKANNLSYFQISILLLILSLTILIMEIPTGIYTDFHGRKKSLVIFASLLGISSFLFSIGSTFIVFSLAIIIFAIAITLWSRTTNSLLFESLKKIKKEKEFSKYLSINHALLVGAGIITNYFIPIIFDFNIKYPFYISTFISLILLIVCLFLKDSLNKIKVVKKQPLIQKIKIQFKDSLKIIKSKKGMLWIILFSGLWGLSIGIFGDLINQPLINEFFNLKTYGIIFASATIVQTLLMIYLDKMIKFSKKFNSYLVLIISWSLSLILITKFITNIYFTIIIMGFIWMLGSFRFILIEDELNKRIKEDSKRATILSSNSMFNSLVLILTLPFFGIILDKTNVINSVYILAISSLIIGIILLIFKNK